MKTQTKGSSSMDSSNTDSNPHRTNSNMDSNPQDSNSMGSSNMDSNPHRTNSNMVSNPPHMGSNSMDSLSCSTWVLDYVLLPYSLTPSLLGSSAVSLERFCAMLQASQEQS